MKFISMSKKLIRQSFLVLLISAIACLNNDINNIESLVIKLIQKEKIEINDYDYVVIVPSNYCKGCLKKSFKEFIPNGKIIVITSLSEGFSCSNCRIIFDVFKEIDSFFTKKTSIISWKILDNGGLKKYRELEVS